MVHGGDAAKAIRLAPRIVHELGARHGFPSVRVGMHTGPGVERDGDWFGATANRGGAGLGLGLENASSAHATRRRTVLSGHANGDDRKAGDVAGSWRRVAEHGESRASTQALSAARIGTYPLWR